MKKNVVFIQDDIILLLRDVHKDFIDLYQLMKKYCEEMMRVRKSNT